MNIKNKLITLIFIHLKHKNFIFVHSTFKKKKKANLNLGLLILRKEYFSLNISEILYYSESSSTICSNNLVLFLQLIKFMRLEN